MKEINAWCTWGNLPIKNKKSNKDIKAKKTSHPTPANQPSHSSGYTGHYSHAIACINKKKSYLYHSDNSCQSSNTLTTGINTTTIKKDKKTNKNLSQVDYYKYYANICPNKESKKLVEISTTSMLVAKVNIKTFPKSFNSEPKFQYMLYN